MLASDVGDDAKNRCHHVKQGSQFTGMIGAGFKHRSLMRMFKIEQGQRHPYLVVKTGFAPEGRQFLTKDRGDQFLCCGFAVGTADCRHRQREIPTVMRPEPSERCTGAVHGNDGAPLKTGRNF